MKLRSKRNGLAVAVCILGLSIFALTLLTTHHETRNKPSVPVKKAQATMSHGGTSPLERLVQRATLVSRMSLPSGKSGQPDQQVCIYKNDELKYPNIRVEERIRKTAKGQEKASRSNAMVADHIVVRRQADVSDEEFTKFCAEAGGSIRKRLPASGLYLVSFDDFDMNTVHEKVEYFKQNRTFTANAEPDYLVYAVNTPDDADFGQLWGMHNTGQEGGLDDADIDAVEAWDITTGSRDVLIGVIDTGVDYTHPDLAANIWTNPGEIAGNGIDDDHNGFIDDIHGWNFSGNNNDPLDDHFHGTHCAGTIGGVGNDGTGIVGVNWQVSIVAIKFMNLFGQGFGSDGIESTYYATSVGCALTSNSWGGGSSSSEMEAAIEHANAHGSLFIAAAGNGGEDGISDDNDALPQYPASYACENIISVAATDHNDNLGSFSNYGLDSVDIAAPGVGILSTFPTYPTFYLAFMGNSSGYGNISGTSMATPHVAGVCGLIKSVAPNMSSHDIKEFLLAGTDPIPALAGKCVTGGRLNAHKALHFLEEEKYLLTSDVTADDSAGNGDGYLNPGEQINIHVTAENIGILEAEGVVATIELAEPNPNVTLLTDTVTVGDIVAGNEVSLSEPFVLKVGGDHPTPQTIKLGLTFTDALSNSWTSTHSFAVNNTFTISGTVWSRESGSPIAGASVLYYGPTNGSTITKADGTYTLTVIEGPHWVMAKADGFTPSDYRDVLTPPSMTHIDFALGAPRIAINPSAITATLSSSEVISQTLTVRNDGNLPLTFSVGGFVDNPENTGKSIDFRFTDYGEIENFTYPWPTHQLSPESRGSGYTLAYSINGSDHVVHASYSSRSGLTPVSNDLQIGTTELYRARVVTRTDDGALEIERIFEHTMQTRSFRVQTVIHNRSDSEISDLVFKSYADLNVDGENESSWNYDAARNLVYTSNINHVGLSTVEIPTLMDIDGSNDFGRKETVVDYPSGPAIIDGMPLLHFNIGTLPVGEDTCLNSIFAVGESSEDLMNEIDAGKRSWLSAPSAGATVAPDGETTMEVYLNGRGLPAGTYTRNLVFTHDAFNASNPIMVPVTMTVPVLQKISVSSSTIDFGTRYVDEVTTDTVEIRNTGNTNVTISSVSSDNLFFTHDGDFPLTLLPLGRTELTCSFSPAITGEQSGTMTIVSDADTPIVDVTMSGTGILGTYIESAPEEIAVAMEPDGVQTETISIASTGDQDLNWTISLDSPYVLKPELDQALENFTANHTAVTSAIPNRFDFKGGEFGTSISRGGFLTGGKGNILSTNLGTYIPYTNNRITAADELGGEYFTSKVSGLFIFACEADGPTYFEISGKLGMLGSASVDATVLTQVHNGITYKGFVKRVYGGLLRPSVNHLIIVEDQPGIDHTYISDSNNDFHRINFINGSTRIYHLAYSTYAGLRGTYVDDVATAQIMKSFLNAVEPSWIKVSPEQGTTAPGSTSYPIVTLNSTSTPAGVYSANLILQHNAVNVTGVITIPVMLTVGNCAPVIESPATASLDLLLVGETTEVSVMAADPNGDDLSYSWFKLNGPGNVVFTSPEAAVSDISFDAPGTYVLVVSISDGSNVTTSEVSVEVIDEAL